MKTSVKIKVTETDIAKGRKKQCKRCPIALAARRAGVIRPEVDPWTMSARSKRGHDAGWFFCSLPKKARHFVERFDDGLEVKPISFVAKFEP